MTTIRRTTALAALAAGLLLGAPALAQAAAPVTPTTSLAASVTDWG